MYLQTTSKLLFAVSALAPFSMYAQTQCPPPDPRGFATYTISVSPADVGAMQPVIVAERLCSAQASTGTLVDFHLYSKPYGSTKEYTLLQTNTVPTNSHGIAPFNVSGLPPAAYQVVTFVHGGAEVNPFGLVSFNVGGGPDAAALNGQYAFLLEGITDVTPLGAGLKTAAAGSFTADGKGNIVSGVIDLNSVQGSFQQLSITGNYTLNAGGAGTVTFNTPYGSETMLITTRPELADKGAIVPSAALTSNQPGFIIGAGTLVRQDTSAFTNPSATSTDYILQLTGETGCSVACAKAGGQAFPITAQGPTNLNFGAQTGSGAAQPNFNASLFQTTGTTSQANSVQANFNQVDGNGRVVVNAATSPAYPNLNPGAPNTFVMYQIDASHLYLLSLDSHSHAALVSGSATK